MKKPIYLITFIFPQQILLTTQPSSLPPHFSLIATSASFFLPFSSFSGLLYIIFLEHPECKNMFKVVLTLKQLSIRLKECELDIFLRKNRENLPLCSKLAILNGSCHINILREFYVSADDPKLSLVFYLLQRNQKKYAGDVTLNVLEWQENVIHTTQTRINNSPDKNSRLTFQFYYFKDESVNDGRSFFLTKEKHRQQYNIIQNSNKELNREKIKLEEEVYHWHKKNQVLQSGCHDMMVNLQEREEYYHNRVGHCQEIINQYTEACQKHREKREGLMRLAEEHGLTKMQSE